MRHTHAAERRRIAPLKQQRQHKAAAEQYARHGEYELAVQAEAAEAPVIPHIAPYKKAETSEHDERHDGQIHERVVRIVHERAERIVRRAHEVEAAVAERRYRMENTHADAAQRPELLHEADGQQPCADALEQERTDQHAPHQPHDAAARIQTEAGSDDHAFAQRDRAPQQQRRRRHDRHKAEAADLDEQENDAFAEKRPVHRRADRDQTGDAGRARRGEQRIDEGRCAAALRGARQHEQQRSCQNNERETNSDHHRRVHRAALRRPPSNTCHSRIPPCLSYI